MLKEDENWWARKPNARVGPISKLENKAESKSEIFDNRNRNAGNDVDWISQHRSTTREASRGIWQG